MAVPDDFVALARKRPHHYHSTNALCPNEQWLDVASHEHELHSAMHVKQPRDRPKITSKARSRMTRKSEVK